MTLCGIPSAMDFSKFTTNSAILEESRKQNELGLKYARYSYALSDMSPGKNECMKLVYEHGIETSGGFPNGGKIENIVEGFTGMLCLYQLIVIENSDDEPLIFVATYQGTRYREENAKKMLELFQNALDELLLS